MINELTHFAIYADDVERAEKFYQKIFSWQTNNYGPADFRQIKVNKESQNPIGALQHRRYSPLDQKVVGFECSIQVEDVENTARLVEEAGGKIVMPKAEIPHVGWLIKFEDTEGNLVCAIQYMNQSP